MRYFVMTLLVFLMYALETPVLNVLGLSAYSVDVSLVAVIYLAATSPAFGGFLTSVLLGFVSDSFTPGGVLGMNMEVMAVAHLLTRAAADRFQVLSPLPLVAVTLVDSILKVLLVFVFSIVFDRTMTEYSMVFEGSVQHALTTSLVALVLVPLFRAVDRRIQGRRYTSTLLRL